MDLITAGRRVPSSELAEYLRMAAERVETGESITGWIAWRPITHDDDPRLEVQGVIASEHGATGAWVIQDFGAEHL